MKENPKRRKNKYNPYKLEFLKQENKYKVKFKDSSNNQVNIEISEQIYTEFDRFELQDISEMNKYDRHIEHLQLNEIALNKRIKEKEINIEDIVIRNLENEKLYEAILKLPKLQKRRLIMYYFKDLALKEIAKKEKVSIRAIQYSINIALKNLKKFLN